MNLAVEDPRAIYVHQHQVQLSDLLKAFRSQSFWWLVLIYGVVAFFLTWPIVVFLHLPAWILILFDALMVIGGPPYHIYDYGRKLQGPKFKRVLEPTDLIIHPDYFAGQDASGTKWEIPWSNFVKAKRVGDLYLIYQNNQQYFVLTRSGLGERAADQVENILVGKGLMKSIRP